MTKNLMKAYNRPAKWFLGIVLATATQFSSQAAISELNVTYYSGYLADFSVQGGTTKTVWATAFLADWISGAPLPPSHSDPFVTFCLDVNNQIANGYWNSGGFGNISLTSQSSPAVRQQNSLYRAANLYQHYAGSIAPVGGTWASATAQQKLDGAALQLAIWEVLYETTAGPFDVDNGAGFNVGTHTSSALIVKANQMLNADGGQWSAIDPSIGTTFWNAVIGLNNDGYRSSQDLIGPFAPIPEPGTYLAGLLLLLPVLVGVIRRKRQTC